MAVARPIYAVLEREVLKLLAQRGRLLSSMVRPLLWLLVIGAGFGAVQSRHGGPGYQAFLVPGVLGMTLLFGGMLAALSMVNDRESGVMRMLVIAPIEHYWIVIAKALSATLAALIQAGLLLILLAVLGYLSFDLSAPLLIAGLVGTAFTCASLGLLVAAFSRTMDNYATLMNLVIFPLFFLSGSLYPVQHLPDALRLVATVNPYTHGVDLLKHSAVSAHPGSFGPDFSVAFDLAVIGAFSAVALTVACVRFSRDAANEPLIHRLARNRVD
jgi:ABC-2 type transport system permease protein